MSRLQYAILACGFVGAFLPEVLDDLLSLGINGAIVRIAAKAAVVGGTYLGYAAAGKLPEPPRG